MATPALNRVAPEVYVRGFDDAYSRIAQVTDSLLERVGAGETVDLLEAFVPVFEALNWAAALSHLESAGAIKIDMDVEELRALRFARDRAHHHWVTALEIADIHVARLLTNRGGVIAPMVVRAWVWVRLSKLPGRSDRKGESSYKSKLAGNAPGLVLENLSDGLNAYRQP